MPPTNGYLIYGYLAKMFQPDMFKPLAKRALLNVFDCIPTNLHVFGHVLNAHVSGQFQDIPLEGFVVAASFVGKSDPDLTNRCTFAAAYARDLQLCLNRV